MGLESLFDNDQNLSLHQNNALKCKTLTWRKLDNLLDRYVNNINNVNEKTNKSKGEKTSVTMSIGKLDGSTAESQSETRRQRLHLQHRSGKTHNDTRVGAHGIPHHLINGCDFGFREGIPENRRGVWTRHPLTRHICAVQFDHSAHRTLSVLGSSPSVICKHLCVPK